MKTFILHNMQLTMLLSCRGDLAGYLRHKLALSTSEIINLALEIFQQKALVQ